MATTTTASAKPRLTSAISGKTLTSAGSGPARSNVTTSSTSGGSGFNALTGSILGLGSKLVADKLARRARAKALAKLIAPTSPGAHKATHKSSLGKKAAIAAKNAAAKAAARAAAKLRDDEIQAEFDRLQAEEEKIGPPNDAVDNGDGTFTTRDGLFKTIYDRDGNIISTEADDQGYAAPTEPTDPLPIPVDPLPVYEDPPSDIGPVIDDTVLDDVVVEDPVEDVVAGDDTASYTDGEGNYYDAEGNFLYSDTEEDPLDAGTDPQDSILTDGEGNYYDADGNFLFNESEEEELLDEEVAFTDEYGNTYGWDGELIAEADHSDFTQQDEYGNVYDWDGELISYADGYTDEEGNLHTVDEETIEEQAYAEGDPYEEEYLYEEEALPEEYVGLKRGGSVTKGGDTEYFKDGSYVTYAADGGYITYDTDGSVYKEPARFDDGGYADSGTEGEIEARENYERIIAEDPNAFYDPDSGLTTEEWQRAVDEGHITNAGDYDFGYNDADHTSTTNTGDPSYLSRLANYLGTSQTATAAGAGGILGALLGSGSFGGSAQGPSSVDMSQVGRIAPRTTDFGIGPTRFVGYDDYGTPQQMPDRYGRELMENLSAPVPVEEPVMKRGGLAGGGTPHYTFGTAVDPLVSLGLRQQAEPQQPQGMRTGGLPALSNVPVSQGRLDFRRGAAVHGPGDGQSDDIPAMLADGEYVIDSETVAQIGNGSTKAGAQALDKFRENIRAHKRAAPLNKIPPKTKALTSYLRGAR